MRSLRDGLRSFREGLEPKLLWDYWLTFKGTAWEIFWGASMIAIAFAIYTLFYAPSKLLLLLYLLLVVFVAGYFMWRSDHLRLMPKFEINGFQLQENPTTSAYERQMYVQVVPKCLTEAVVRNCSGYLLRVYYRRIEGEPWRSTEANEPLLLEWSFYGFAPLTLRPGIDQRLNVCFWRTNPLLSVARTIIPRISPESVRYAEVFKPRGIFRFEIRVMAEECAPVDVSVEVSIDGREWNKPSVKFSSDHLPVNSILLPDS